MLSEAIEQSVRTSINDCLGIQELKLGRLSCHTRCYTEVRWYWIVVVPRGRGIEFLSRIVFIDDSSTILHGADDTVHRVDQQIKVDCELDRIALRPEFLFGDAKPTELGGKGGPSFCRIVVRTWSWIAQFDVVGSAAIRETGVLEAIDQFKQQIKEYS